MLRDVMSASGDEEDATGDVRIPGREVGTGMNRMTRTLFYREMKEYFI